MGNRTQRGSGHATTCSIATSFCRGYVGGSSQGRAIISANVIVGAVLMLLMIMLLSAFALEATACGVGVANCD